MRFSDKTRINTLLITANNNADFRMSSILTSLNSVELLSMNTVLISDPIGGLSRNGPVNVRVMLIV